MALRSAAAASLGAGRPTQQQGECDENALEKGSNCWPTPNHMPHLTIHLGLSTWMIRQVFPDQTDISERRFVGQWRRCP